MFSLSDALRSNAQSRQSYLIHNKQPSQVSHHDKQPKISSEPGFMETLLIIIITIPLGLLILCGGYAVWSKTQV